MEDWAEIRRMYRAEDAPIKEITAPLADNPGASTFAELQKVKIRNPLVKAWFSSQA